MKHFLFCLCAVLSLLTACTSDEPMSDKIGESQTKPQVVGSPTKRSVDEAIAIANGAISLLGNTNETVVESRGIGRVVDYKVPVYAVSNPRSRVCNGDTLLYVVNFADNNGFAVIPAMRGAPELLAVTECGHFNPTDSTDVPAFNYWYRNVVSILAAGDMFEVDTTGMYTKIPLPDDRSKNKSERDTVWYAKVPPRLTVAWGQGGSNFGTCEGLECPNRIAGCANTAVAMVMSYVEKPSNMILGYKKDAPSIYLDWMELKKYCSTNGDRLILFPTSDYPIRERLSQLCRELGYRANSDYSSPEQTSTNSTNVLVVLNGLGILNGYDWSSGSGFYSIKTMDNSIALVRGATDDNSGHMWVEDGALDFKIRTRNYESDDNGKTWRLVKTILSDEYKYIHRNWGWYNRCNGVFLIDDFYAKGVGDLKNNVKHRQVLK